MSSRDGNEGPVGVIKTDEPRQESCRAGMLHGPGAVTPGDKAICVTPEAQGGGGQKTFKQSLDAGDDTLCFSLRVTDHRVVIALCGRQNRRNLKYVCVLIGNAVDLSFTAQ